MESSYSPAMPEAVKNFDAPKFATDVKGITADAKEQARIVADRGKEVASDVAGRAKDLIDEVKSGGRELVDGYAQVLQRGKQQLSDVSTRVSEYADHNTALVAGGALVAGFLLGFAISRRSA